MSQSTVFKVDIMTFSQREQQCWNIEMSIVIVFPITSCLLKIFTNSIESILVKVFL